MVGSKIYENDSYLRAVVGTDYRESGAMQFKKFEFFFISPKDPFSKLFSNTVTIFKSSSEAPFWWKIGKFKIGLNLKIMQIRAFSKPAYEKNERQSILHLYKLWYTFLKVTFKLYFISIWDFFYFLHPCKESNVSSFVDTVNFQKVMHQSIPAASQAPPPPAPRATAGHLPAFSVPGVGHLQILCCPGAGHLPTPGPFPSFCHARGFLSEYNYTDNFTRKESRFGHLSWTGKNWRGCTGMFLILCMHFIIAYKARITWRNRELSTWINIFWLLNQNSVDIIWKISFYIYKAIHNI